MSNALTIFDSPQLAVPDHLRDTFGDEKNITDRVSVPSLSYEGKVWTISANGEKTKLVKRDEDGDEVPMQVMRVAVLDYAKRRGRAYYPGTYDPAKASAPECWSEDGVKPHPSIAEPKCGTCDGCPMAVKGSKVTDSGKAVTACSQHRMVVVAPLGKLDMPLRMKLAITSDWDKNNPEMETQGWFAFNNYTDFLRTKGINHTAQLVTKMRFDPNAPYPKVMFSPDRWLNESEAAKVKPLLKSEQVATLLAGTWTPAGVDGKKIEPSAPKVAAADEEELPPPPKAAKKTVVPVDDEEEEVIPPPKKAAKPAPVVEDDDEEEIVVPPKKSAAKKAAVVEDDDDEDIVVPQAAKPKVSSEPKAEPKKAAAKKAADPEPSTNVPDEVAALLNEWGED